ncbi:MAG: DUF4170 domain-containing protein [Alphaproteobacteria bacterium]
MIIRHFRRCVRGLPALGLVLPRARRCGTRRSIRDGDLERDSGAFGSYEAAPEEWKSTNCQTVDNALFRYRIAPRF